LIARIVFYVYVIQPNHQKSVKKASYLYQVALKIW